jgi:hypothetical protein
MTENDLIYRIIQESKPGTPSQQRIIEDDIMLVRVALDCIYACQETGPSIWNIMNTIFEVRFPYVSSVLLSAQFVYQFYLVIVIRI